MVTIDAKLSPAQDEFLFPPDGVEGFDVEVRHQYDDSMAVFFEMYEQLPYSDRHWYTPHHAAGLVTATGKVKWLQGAHPLGWTP